MSTHHAADWVVEMRIIAMNVAFQEIFSTALNPFLLLINP